MTEVIFDMSIVRIFKEIEKKTMGNFYTLLWLWSAEFSKSFGLRNLCYSKISAMMLLGYRNAGISRKPRVRMILICLASKCSILK